MTTASPGPPAQSVRDALELLETQFDGVAEGVANGRYVFWLGSGISRDRLPNLRVLVRRVLEFLHGHCSPSSTGEPYRNALTAAINLGLRPHEVALIDINSPISGWPGLDDLLDSLVDKYSELLDIPVDGQDEDFLLWEAVDVRTTYGSPHPPDCEHLCVAMLALEGAITDIASPNWDGLNEAAFAELGFTVDDVLKVVVLEDDVRLPDRAVTLIKFHGCAVRAAADPGRYRDALVATRTQITKWTTGDADRVLRERLVALATDRPTLIIGLSAQDENIQQFFAAAANALAWEWSSALPPQVVAGGSLGGDQLNILRVMFGSQRAGEVTSEALIPAYAKTFLPGLVLSSLGYKLRAYLTKANAPQLTADDAEQLADGLTELGHRVADAAGSDERAFIKRLAAGQGRLLGLMRTGIEPVGASPSYEPIGSLPADRINDDVGATTGGVPELAAALALLGRGTASGAWALSAQDIATAGAAPLRIVTATATSRVFFAANGAAGTRLIADGPADPDDPQTVIIHSTEPVQQLKRSSRSAVGRSGRPRRREVGMREMLSDASGLAELEDTFRQQASL